MIDLAIEQELYLKEFYNDLFIEQIEFNGDEFVWKMSKTTTELEECNHGWRAWQASAQREGYKLVSVNNINIADMIWGKCSCGSSRSPIVSDREGYNLIHCFACGANKYIHKDY